MELFQCDECEKKFPNRGVLALHKKKHIAAFKCDHCNLKGTSPKQLQVHKHKTIIPDSFSNIGSKRDHTMVPKSKALNENSPPRKVKKTNSRPKVT